MRADEIYLKLAKFVGRDRNIGKRAEAGVDAVYNLASLDYVFNEASRPLYARPCAGSERHVKPVGNLGGLLQSKGCAINLDHVGRSLFERMLEVKSRLFHLRSECFD
jgi:hypothetical protein